MSKANITFGLGSRVGPVLILDSMESQDKILPEVAATSIDCPSGKDVAVIQPDKDIKFADTSDKLAAGNGHLIRGGTTFSVKFDSGEKLWLQVVPDA